MHRLFLSQRCVRAASCGLSATAEFLRSNAVGNGVDLFEKRGVPSLSLPPLPSLLPLPICLTLPPLGPCTLTRITSPSSVRRAAKGSVEISASKKSKTSRRNSHDIREEVTQTDIQLRSATTRRCIGPHTNINFGNSNFTVAGPRV